MNNSFYFKIKQYPVLCLLNAEQKKKGADFSLPTILESRNFCSSYVLGLGL